MILAMAERFGIDARLLAALRLTENGGPGQEFGIMLPGVETFEQEAEVAARTIRNVMARYRAHVGREPVGADGRLTEDFLRYFSWGGPGYPGYAPVGAPNDPSGLNRHHFPNLLAFYRQAEIV